ncbi:MAG: hypothetical protein ACRD4F_07140 [Candidatus Angelobacter sp.]
MKQATVILTAVLVCAFVALGWRSMAQQTSNGGTHVRTPHLLADNMQHKLDHIQQNGARPYPDQNPTVFTEDEVNDYLASGRVEIPKGVKKVRLQGQLGRVDAFLTVDFDQLRENQRSSNPLLGLFSGTHDVTIESEAAGAGGHGKVQVKIVTIDGMEVPRMALEYFVEKYITPKYPNVGMDSQFQLPDKIDMATVGYHKLTVTQK